MPSYTRANGSILDVVGMGVNRIGMQRSTVVKRLNAGDKEGAAQAILLWKKPPEIMSRRRGEQNEFALGAYQARVA